LHLQTVKVAELRFKFLSPVPPSTYTSRGERRAAIVNVERRPSFLFLFFPLFIFFLFHGAHLKTHNDRQVRGSERRPLCHRALRVDSRPRNSIPALGGDSPLDRRRIPRSRPRRAPTRPPPREYIFLIINTGAQARKADS